MFDRVKYKKFAKIQLKKRWTIPVLVTLFCGIITGIMNVPDFSNNITEVSKKIGENATELSIITENLPKPTGVLAYLISLLAFAAIFISMIFEIARTNLYLKMSKSPDPVKFSDFIEGFSMWAKGILTGLWVSLWTYLWTLLFIFPGIVKYYSYSMTLPLVTEYPELSINKAMKISMTITRGHKMDLFVLDLSFLGWAILATIPAGLGFLWLEPYYNMTKINAYHGLLKEAVTTGLITQEDLKD